MDERRELAAALRHLVELDRQMGVEFLPRPPLIEVAPAQRPSPVVAMRPAAVPAAASMPVPAPQAERPASPALPAPSGLAAADLAALATCIAACRRCGLCEGRGKTVPGEGNPAAELVFVGEGPGQEEDLQGRPFVGPAGQLLDRMIVAMGLSREQVFIANVVKCRPPGNRTPQPDEEAACMPFLVRQLEAIRPKLICSLGNTPLRALTNDPKAGITRLHGQRLEWRGIPLIPTFHPSYLLRNESAKKPCWEDLKLVLQALGRPLPKRG